MFSFNLFFQEKLLGAYDILDSVLYVGDTLANQREKIFYFLKLRRYNASVLGGVGKEDAMLNGVAGKSTWREGAFDLRFEEDKTVLIASSE